MQKNVYITYHFNKTNQGNDLMVELGHPLLPGGLLEGKKKRK